MATVSELQETKIYAIHKPRLRKIHSPVLARIRQEDDTEENERIQGGVESRGSNSCIRCAVHATRENRNKSRSKQIDAVDSKQIAFDSGRRDISCILGGDGPLWLSV